MVLYGAYGEPALSAPEGWGMPPLRYLDRDLQHSLHRHARDPRISSATKDNGGSNVRPA